MKNQTGKYLKYAIGEIALVMIGILLALQVNEWNKERNREKSEQVIIEQLITDLSQSQSELEYQHSYNLRIARIHAQVLRAYWKTELPDDIQKYVRGGGGSNVYSPVLGTAQSLINSGKLDIIDSKELKNAIVAYVEEVGYRLRDINRYEESYFRPGVAALNEAIPSTYRSKDEFNAQGVSNRWKWTYDRNLNSIPEFVDKIPFKSDLKKLFEDKAFFMANEKLYLYHRNISFRYTEILNRTNELLVELYLRSDKHLELGRKLANNNYYLVFDTDDLQILKRADALLSDASKWSKSSTEDCDENGTEGRFSLICAIKIASKDVVDKWEEESYRPATRLVLHKLLEDKNRRYVINMVEEWNNHPDTTFEEVKKLLSDCIEIIKNQVSNND